MRHFINPSGTNHAIGGLSKRELFAAFALHGLLSNPRRSYQDEVAWTRECLDKEPIHVCEREAAREFAAKAVLIAEELIDEIEDSVEEACDRAVQEHFHP